jgi:hypothetical protein
LFAQPVGVGAVENRCREQVWELGVDVGCFVLVALEHHHRVPEGAKAVQPARGAQAEEAAAFGFHPRREAGEVQQAGDVLLAPPSRERVRQVERL